MHTTIAGLDVEVLQAAAGAPSAAVILCHGFGAPGDDLVPLHDELLRLEPRLASTRFYFPAAPLALPGPGFGGRAWWMIDVEALMAAEHATAEARRAFTQTEPEGMAAARRALRKLVDEVATGDGLPMNRVTLGGFSQGAMLATDVALRLDEAPAGLVILSGTLLLEPVWRARATARAGLPVFQSHGRSDAILSYAAAQSLHELLEACGLRVDFVPFDGGHGIGPGVLPALAAFLGRGLPG